MSLFLHVSSVDRDGIHVEQAVSVLCKRVCVCARERERERERESLYHKVLGASCVLKRRYIHLSICTARPSAI